MKLKMFEQFVNEKNVDFFDIDPKNPPSSDDSVNYVAKHAIGELVNFTFNGVKIPAIVRVIYHTNGKVRYAIRLIGTDEEGKEYYSTIHNVDSIFVEDSLDKDGKRTIYDSDSMEDFDNYS